MYNLECGTCGRTFYKPEHLKRHERRHTGSRPFSCRTCGRAFARQDSLLRHAKLHARLRDNAYTSPPSSAGAAACSPDEALYPSQSSLPQYPVGKELDLCDAGDPPLATQSIRSVADVEHNVTDCALPVLDLNLMWPDSEDLFQALLTSKDGKDWQSPLGPTCIGTPTSASLPALSPFRFGDQQPSIDNIPLGVNNRAVNEVSAMVNAQSQHVTASVQSLQIDSSFLDQCLHMFFVRFVSTFPILHRPTFVFRDCHHTLLLNAIAIGSLYVGHKDAAAKGEVLWRLAHTAIANLWQAMITDRGPYDDRPGVQLSLSALLGQIYGVLSRSRTIRSTSQAFHLLSFSWARQCGLLDVKQDTVMPEPALDATQEEKNRFWRRWVSKEIQHRCLLAHYALDGLIARMSGSSTSEKHKLLRQALPSSETLFKATTADEFLVHYTGQWGPRLTFRDALKQLYKPDSGASIVRDSHTAFSLTVLTEALQWKISEVREDEFAGEQHDLDQALDRLRDVITSCPSLSNTERSEALLRWHALCLESIVNTVALSQYVCSLHSIKQDVWPELVSQDAVIEMPSWANSQQGRRALLHAVAIQEIAEELPRGRAHTKHMPAALFAAATVSAVFCLSGVTTINLPNTIDWHKVLVPDCARQASGGFEDETKAFICGDIDTSTVAFGVFRKLPYEFNSMQKLFGCLATQWGIAQDMDVVVREWSSLFH